MKVMEREILTESDVKLLLSALTSLKKGDGSVRLPIEWTGLPGKLSEAFNEVVELNDGMSQELARLRRRLANTGSSSNALPWAK